MEVVRLCPAVAVGWPLYIQALPPADSVALGEAALWDLPLSTGLAEGTEHICLPSTTVRSWEARVEMGALLFFCFKATACAELRLSIRRGREQLLLFLQRGSD